MLYYEQYPLRRNERTAHAWIRRNDSQMPIKVKSTVDDPHLIARRRSQLVLAAIKLFSRQGFHSTTVKDIASQARVSAGLVYHYVHDKQDLLFLSLMHIVETNRQEIPAALHGVSDPLLKVKRAMDAYARVMSANRDAVLLTYRETKSLTRAYREVLKSMELDTNRLIESCIDECVALKLMQPVDTELLTYQLVVLAHAWALKHWRLQQLTSLEDYIAHSIHSVWISKLTGPGLRRYVQLCKTEIPPHSPAPPKPRSSRVSTTRRADKGS